MTSLQNQVSLVLVRGSPLDAGASEDPYKWPRERTGQTTPFFYPELFL